MDIERIQGYIIDFQKKTLPKVTSRGLELPRPTESAVAIIGARRVGKTYRTFQYVNELVEEGVTKDAICRIQFNDLRLQDMSRQLLPVIEDAYYALYPQFRHNRDVYFIFDEIHRVDGWEDFVLGLLDNHRHHVLITGSTAKLKTGEIASALRGKCFTRQLHAFSFREFIRHLGIQEDMVSFSGRDMLQNSFKQYLFQGGYPGLFVYDQSMHTEQLQNYWETMLLRDVLEAHPHENINIELLYYFAQELISRTGCPVTIRKIMAVMKEAGLLFSAETIYKYLRYLTEAFALSSVYFYSRSEAIRNRNYQKIYATDWALAQAVCRGESLDSTRMFENLVFIELLRRNFKISYFRTRKEQEIDFVVLDDNNEVHIYQVCYELSSNNRDREIQPIIDSFEYLKAKSATIITVYQEDKINNNGITIQVIPAWKWLLL